MEGNYIYRVVWKNEQHCKIMSQDKKIQINLKKKIWKRTQE